MDTTEQAAVTTEQIRSIFQKLLLLDGDAHRRIEGDLWNLGPEGIEKFKEIIFVDYAKARQQGRLLWFAMGGTVFAVVFMAFAGGMSDMGPFLKSNWWIFV